MQLIFLSTVISLIGCVAGLVEDNFLLVVDTNNKAIQQVDLSDGSVWKIPLPQMNYPVRVDFNPTDKKLYWTDLRSDVIKRSNLDGTAEEIVTSLHIGSYLFGLAIDMVSGLVYYTEGGADIIAVVTLDGRYHFTLITEDMDQPQDIVLDLERGLMYWTDNGQTPRIEKAAMDGTRRGVVISFDFVTSPTGLTIDTKGERLYWCDSHAQTIRSVSVDGNDMNILVDSPGSTFYGIAFLAENLYFTAVSLSYISKITLSDTSPTPVQVGPAVFNRPTGITAYRRTERTYGYEAKSVCSLSNGGCEHVCLATPDGPQCACQDGFIAEKACSTSKYQCPQVHYKRKGEIRSPGYPGYGNNVYCMITIHTNNTAKKEHVIRFYVEEFDMQDKYDYLVIGDHKYSSLQRQFTYSVSTLTEDTKWLFVTDGSIVGRGFHFKYELFRVVQCGSQPCKNGGTCIEGKFCECADGYEGDWCEKDIATTSTTTMTTSTATMTTTTTSITPITSTPKPKKTTSTTTITTPATTATTTTTTLTSTKATPTTTPKPEKTTPTMTLTTPATTAAIPTAAATPKSITILPSTTSIMTEELSSPSAAPLNQRNVALTTTAIGLLVAGLAGLVILATLIGAAIYLVIKKSRNTPTQPEAQNTTNDDTQRRQLNADRTRGISNVYDHLDSTHETSNVYSRLHGGETGDGSRYVRHNIVNTSQTSHVCDHLDTTQETSRVCTRLNVGGVTRGETGDGSRHGRYGVVDSSQTPHVYGHLSADRQRERPAVYTVLQYDNRGYDPGTENEGTYATIS